MYQQIRGALGQLRARLAGADVRGAGARSPRSHPPLSSYDAITRELASMASPALLDGIARAC